LETKRKIKTHQDLEVYRVAFDAAMRVFDLAEAWRKRRYKAAFLAKLNDCEAEAAETQVWIEFSVKCGYLDTNSGREHYETYNQILGGIVRMINNPNTWIL
jgi:four helix bundle protein